MLCALLLSATLALPADAGQESAGQAQTTTRIELVARVGETRFAAYNPSEQPQLLLLGRIGGPAPCGLLLAPGQSFETRFPAVLTEELAIEVLTRTPHGVHTTGALPLRALAAAHYDALWIEGSELGSYAWGQQAESLEWIAPSGSLSALPPPTNTAAPHAPVITPAKGKPCDSPPHMENKPLPPF
jgi:hypothetical protein